MKSKTTKKVIDLLFEMHKSGEIEKEEVSALATLISYIWWREIRAMILSTYKKQQIHEDNKYENKKNTSHRL